MHWMRKPRLNSAVATVAVETVLSLLRVASVSLVMFCSPPVSVNRRLTDRLAKAGLEEIEIAAFIGLLDVTRKHPAVAALEARGGLLPLGAAPGELRLAHIEVDAARGDVERDLVAVPHQRQRSANIGLRRNMQDAGTIAGAAHARVRQADHVAHALLH